MLTLARVIVRLISKDFEIGDDCPTDSRTACLISLNKSLQDYAYGFGFNRWVFAVSGLSALQTPTVIL